MCAVPGGGSVARDQRTVRRCENGANRHSIFNVGNSAAGSGSLYVDDSNFDSSDLPNVRSPFLVLFVETVLLTELHFMATFLSNTFETVFNFVECYCISDRFSCFS